MPCSCRQENPIEDLLPLIFGGIVVAGVGFLVYRQMSKPHTAPATAASSVLGTTSVQLVAGQSQQSIRAVPGSTIDVSLPPGGTWAPDNINSLPVTSNAADGNETGGAATVGGTDDDTFAYTPDPSGGYVVAYGWNDSTAGPQLTTLSIGTSS